MSGLVGFVLARIREDEEAAQRIQNSSHFHGVDSDVEAEVMRFADPRRVLAECVAKRVLIHEAQFALSFVLNNTCRILARPYADHPDFREEWR